jgi:hypothetical protein
MRTVQAALLLLILVAAGAASDNTSVQVSEDVAALTRPILDAIRDGRPSGNLLYELTNKRGRAADEALVVLLCFDVGESQEEADAIISRGKRTLPLLRKYRNAVPLIPNRNYPNTMLHSDEIKAEKFSGVIRFIQEGRRGTWDDPTG